MSKEEFKGFCLFNDIADKALRNRNRAVVLTNIAEDRTRNRLISANGAGLILGYFKEIPEEDRQDVKERFTQNMKERGYVISAA